jgi:hypothetical protein
MSFGGIATLREDALIGSVMADASPTLDVVVGHSDLRVAFYFDNPHRRIART